MHTFRPVPGVTVLCDPQEVPGLGHLPVSASVLHAPEPVVVDTGLGLDDGDRELRAFRPALFDSPATSA